MEGFSKATARTAPQPTTPFEEYMISHMTKLEGYVSSLDGRMSSFVQHTTAFEAFVTTSLTNLNEFALQTTESIKDLSESIAYVANITVTKEELAEQLKAFATKDELAEQLKNFVTKDALAEQLKNFPTKEDLRLGLAGVEYRFKSWVDDKVITLGVKPMILAEDKKIDEVVDSLEEEAVFSSTQSARLKNLGPFHPAA